MINEIAAVRGFRRLRVLVVGDAMLDRYYLGTASRLSPEAPIPVIKAERQLYLPGGAANTAANARALGAKTTLLAVTGTDDESEILRRVLRERQVGLAHLVEDSTRPTTTKLRILADGHFIARYDSESELDISGKPEEELLDAFRHLFRDSDVVIISDYMKGVITTRLVRELGSLNRGNEHLAVVDSKDLSRHRFRNISVITPNHLEAQKACNVDASMIRDKLNDESLEKLGRSLLSQIGTKWVMMTVGSEGALLFERGVPPVRIRAREIRNPQVVGAGDTLTATLALALASNLGIHEASHIAVEAAGIAVSKEFTAVVESQELLEQLGRWEGVGYRDGLARHAREYRAQGKRVVFADGAFDGIHSGHIAFLRQARSLGDILLVGVNSDASLVRATGRKPLLPEEERLAVVSAVDVVDHAALIQEDTPTSLVREIRPHVHAKARQNADEAPAHYPAPMQTGTEVVELPVHQPASHSALRERISGETVHFILDDTEGAKPEEAAPEDGMTDPEAFPDSRQRELLGEQV